MRNYLVVAVLPVFLVLYSFRLPAQVCNVRSSDILVTEWSPAAGTIARYASGVLDTNHSIGFIIILGCTGRGIFTIEGGWETDASEGIYANLVLTGYDGHREPHALCNGNMMEHYLETDSEHTIIHDLVLKNLWKYIAEGKVAEDSLKPVWYHLEKDDDDVAPSLIVKDRTSHKIFNWSIVASPSMCWCYYEWECTVYDAEKR